MFIFIMYYIRFSNSTKLCLFKVKKIEFDCEKQNTVFQFSCIIWGCEPFYTTAKILQMNYVMGLSSLSYDDWVASKQ